MGLKNKLYFSNEVLKKLKQHILNILKGNHMHAKIVSKCVFQKIGLLGRTGLSTSRIKRKLNNVHKTKCILKTIR